MGSTAVFIIHKANVEWYCEVRHPSVLDYQAKTAARPHPIHHHLDGTVSGTRRLMDVLNRQ